MTSTSTGHAQPQDNVQPSAQVQADFFSKLARLENAILSHQHPRYRLPPAEVERLARALSDASLAASAQQKLGAVTNGVTPHRAEAPALEASTARLPSHRDPLSQWPAADKETHAKTTSSGIDPVLLTKSDDLVKAEINLKRIRIEKSLKESVNSSKRDAVKDKELASWLGPITFDVAKVLEAATSIIKPHSGLKNLAANENCSVNSSSDEFSYYSSRVNSWTRSPGGKDSGLDRDLPVADRDSLANAPPASTQGNDSSLQPVAVREPRVSGLGPRDNTGVAQRADKLPHPILQHADVTDSSENSHAFMNDVRDPREESYSPPGIAHGDEPHPLQQSAPISPSQSFKPGYHAKRLSYEGARTRESESYSPPPPPEIPVVANHLEAPLAPQPSRISPIALGNLPQNTQNDGNAKKAPKQNQSNTKQDKKKTKGQKAKEAKKAQNTSDFGSRKASAQQLASGPRKRRRETDHDDDSRRVSGQQAIVSPPPTPYIKQEPVSPPQLTSRFGAEPPRRLVLHDDGRADIEVLTPRYTQHSRLHENVYSQSNDATLRPAQPRSSRYSDQEPIVIDESDGSSPAARRKPIRDEGDLRRIASLQYASRPYSPVERTSPRFAEEQQHTRPMSRTLVERLVARPYHYYEEQEIQAPLQHHLQERRMNPVFVGDEYLATPPQISSQPPAKRRIVVDQYGNEYIAVPARSSINQQIPRELPDYAEPTSPYRRQNLRGQSMQAEPRFVEHRPARQQPQIIELDDDEDDYQRMPPPQVVPRKRPMELRDDRFTQPMYYSNQQAYRSASLQPPAPSNDTRYQYMPAQVPTRNPEVGAPSVRERAYSARPNLAQKEEFYSTTSRY